MNTRFRSLHPTVASPLAATRAPESFLPLSAGQWLLNLCWYFRKNKKKPNKKASLGSNGTFTPSCHTAPHSQCCSKGGENCCLSLACPARTQASTQSLPGGVSYSPFKSNHHLKEGFCEGKKNSIITMVIPVTASEINLSKSSRNTCKKHKPVELQSLWELEGFTKEDYKFPQGLNNACCSQFSFFNSLPSYISTMGCEPPRKAALQK